MNIFLATVGAVLVLLSLVDMIWTTVAVSAGAGPVTGRLTAGLWHGVRRIAGQGQNHRLLRLGGIAIVCSVFITWIVMLVIGWGLVFTASPGAVIDVSASAPATDMERFYFAGYVAATLGNGSYAPGYGLWQVLTVLAAFSGLLVATMAITYLVPVTSAVVGRRKLALQISSLGEDPVAIVRAALTDRDWQAFDRQLESIGDGLSQLGEQHLAYPVLHYFHDIDRPAAASVNIAVLDEVLTIMRYGLPEETRPSPVTLRSVRNSLGSFLSALEAGHISEADEDPASEALEMLRELDIVTVSDEDFAEALEDNARRRRLLLAFVEDDGWTWASVYDAGEGGQTVRDGVSEQDIDSAA